MAHMRKEDLKNELANMTEKEVAEVFVQAKKEKADRLKQQAQAHEQVAEDMRRYKPR